GGGGRERRCGQAMFSRFTVLGARRHAWPWHADAGKPSMPRVAVEATLQAPMGALRVTTTHLEYYSALQRRAQAHRLRELHAEACERAALPPLENSEESNATFRPAPPSASAILTGDFNFPPDDPSHEDIQRPPGSGAPRYRDAWALAHGRQPHTPTFCVHDDSFSTTPYCCA